MNTLLKTLLLSLGLISFSYGMSEYADYRIKTELATELNIHSQYISFLYETGQGCQEEETLWDADLGICIHNVAMVAEM